VSREYRLVQVDVFTDRPLAGNPLAVVLAAQGLGAADMQAIARENNLSETSFVFPSIRSDCAARVRIFTPAQEIPFAGHPTLGTAWVLATEGLLPPGTRRFALEEGLGPVPVELEGAPEQPAFVWMSQRDATFGPVEKDRAAIASALGLGEAELQPDAPIQSVSAGNPFLFVPLRDPATVDRASLDVRELLATLGESGTLGVFIFAMDPRSGQGRIYSRMFPFAGVPEDPATGSASGPLGAYLVRHRLVPGEGPLSLVSEQGTKMGRQSFVHIRLRAIEGQARDIRVGGGVVPVLDGRLCLP
jgi:trans-2,3-dihydro-3-hydroxyanthranilate isomerase